MEEMGAREHGDGRFAVGPHPVAVPGRDVGQRRAEGALAAGDALWGGARGVRAHGAARGLRRGRHPNARAERAGGGACIVRAARRCGSQCAGGGDRYLVFATVDPEAGSNGIAAFLVEGDAGFRFGAERRWESVLPGHRAGVRGLRGSRREPTRRGRRGVSHRAVRARRGPDRGGMRGLARSGWRPPLATSASARRSDRR